MFIQNNVTKLFNLYLYDFSRFENIEALVKLVNLFFSSILPDELSLEELFSLRFDEKCRSSIAEKVNHHENMIKAIYDVAKEMSHIKKYLYLWYHKEHDTDTNSLIEQIQFSAGRLWVLTGMCLLEIFSAISLVDPLQKTKVRNECVDAEVNY